MLDPRKSISIPEINFGVVADEANVRIYYYAKEGADWAGCTAQSTIKGTVDEDYTTEQIDVDAKYLKAGLLEATRPIYKNELRHGIDLTQESPYFVVEGLMTSRGPSEYVIPATISADESKDTLPYGYAEEYEVKGIAASAFNVPDDHVTEYGYTQVTNVTIGENINKIGYYVFNAGVTLTIPADTELTADSADGEIFTDDGSVPDDGIMVHINYGRDKVAWDASDVKQLFENHTLLSGYTYKYKVAFTDGTSYIWEETSAEG